MAPPPAGRLDVLAAIKAHSQHLTTASASGDGGGGGARGGTPGPSSSDTAGDGGWSSDEWRGAFQQLVCAQPQPLKVEGALSSHLFFAEDSCAPPQLPLLPNAPRAVSSGEAGGIIGAGGVRCGRRAGRPALVRPARGLTDATARKLKRHKQHLNVGQPCWNRTCRTGALRTRRTRRRGWWWRRWRWRGGGWRRRRRRRSRQAPARVRAPLAPRHPRGHRPHRLARDTVPQRHRPHLVSPHRRRVLAAGRALHYFNYSTFQLDLRYPWRGVFVTDTSPNSPIKKCTPPVR